MIKYTRKLDIVAWVAMLLILIGCEQGNQDLSNAPKYTTPTPAVLRNIPITNLSVQVSIDNVTKTYQGADFPDGQWRIEYDLLPNKTYNVMVQWFVLTHLVLEETGQITTDPEQQMITPDLEFISAGYPRFDDDCDGQSNLDEIRNGSNPNADEDTDQSACSAGSGQAIFGRVDFIYDNASGNTIRFNINQATGFQPIAGSDSDCRVFDNNFGTSAVACILPYDWQEQQWYNIGFEELSATSWKATVLDEASGISQDIGIIETQPNIDWVRPQSILSHRTSFESQECALGIAPVSMQFKQGVANEIHSIETIQVKSGDCVIAGAGWSEGIRTVDGELVHRFTLGRPE